MPASGRKVPTGSFLGIAHAARYGVQKDLKEAALAFPEGARRQEGVPHRTGRSRRLPRHDGPEQAHPHHRVDRADASRSRVADSPASMSAFFVAAQRTGGTGAPARPRAKEWNGTCHPLAFHPRMDGRGARPPSAGPAKRKRTYMPDCVVKRFQQWHRLAPTASRSTPPTARSILFKDTLQGHLLRRAPPPSRKGKLLAREPFTCRQRPRRISVAESAGNKIFQWLENLLRAAEPAGGPGALLLLPLPVCFSLASPFFLFPSSFLLLYILPLPAHSPPP